MCGGSITKLVAEATNDMPILHSTDAIMQRSKDSTAKRLSTVIIDFIQLQSSTGTSPPFDCVVVIFGAR